MSRAIVVVSFMLPLTLCGSYAAADVPPEPGYVESCTLENQQKTGKSCEMCGDAYHGAPDACKDRYEVKGYTKACQTRGASTWDEIWCTGAAAKPEAEKPTDKPAQKPAEKQAEKSPAAADSTPPATTSGCRISEQGRWPTAALLLLAIVGVRRRST